MARRNSSASLVGLILFALCVSIATPAFVAISADTAWAQEGDRPRKGGLFEFLFGRRDRPEPQKAKPRVVRRAPAAAPADAAPRAPKPQAVEKLDNARLVLVIGDFMASGLAEGLDDAYAQSPGVRVESRTNGSSGFVRDDFYNWPAEIGPIIEEVKPAVVVVMIGSNDRQQLAVNGNREEVRTDAWTAEYTDRVRRLAVEIRRARVPLLWVGMPAFKSPSMSADMLAFNDIYRGVAEEVGGEFVDIWDGFVDENGAFATVGPDINGQRVRLRGSDGINMTGAGKRKLAFYVEKPLNKLLGGAVAPGIASLAPDTGIGLGLGGQNPAEIDRTPPIALGDPALDGSGALLGAQISGQPDEQLGIPVEELVQKGIAPPAQPGRADDFSTDKTTTSTAADTAAPDSVSSTQPVRLQSVE